MRFSVLALLFVLLLAGCDSGPGAEEEPDSDPPENGSSETADVTVSIDTGRDRAPISPYIYGSNQDRSSDDVWTVRRLGGNRLTGYNWETNHSNAGSDWQHSSDNFLLTNAGIPEAQWDEPARVMTHWHDRSLDRGAASIITLQMAGYVARDDDGTVSEAETAPSSRWDAVAYRKDAPFATAPDLEDGTVYMDELVHVLTRRYGDATAPDGIRWYSLDNEPGLWAHTHPRLHPEPVEAEELVQRSIELATAVKDVDPNSEIVGPALYGFAAYLHLQDAPDWPAAGTGYTWFVDYYLDRMRQAEQEHGRRLLDAFDVHWYPEAQGDHRILDPDATTDADVAARLQAPRTLWDSTYTEDSWIADCCSEYLPILPRLRQAIDTYYPGTALAITEYDYGAKDAISGGLTQADVLGAFGRYGVDLATLWGIGPEDDYAASAFALYRNYDGRGSTYGNTAVRARTDDREHTSVYASIEDDDPSTLHVILINKHRDEALEVEVDVESSASYASSEVWRFDAEHAALARATAIEDAAEIVDNTVRYVLPRLTAAHVVLRTTSAD